MPSADRLIASCGSWHDFWERASELSNTEKGIAFERLTQLYLETTPEYRTKLQNIMDVARCSTGNSPTTKSSRLRRRYRSDRSHARRGILGDTVKIPQPAGQAAH